MNDRMRAPPTYCPAVVTDRVSSGRVVSDRVVSGRVVSDRVVSDRVVSDRVPRRPAVRAGGAWRSILSTIPRTRWPILLLLATPICALRLSAAPLAVEPSPILAIGESAVRVKDIADLQGVRENQLVGYGLVVGLNGTGDKLDNAGFTRESLVGMLERLGVNTRDQIAKLQTKNVAAVMVTAGLPAFARTGSRIDVAVSAIGDATNLAGGTLLVTPLMAADGEVYGVAQGAVTTGAIAAKGAGASVTRNVPTSGKIANGANVEREVNFSLDSRHDLNLSLRNPDLTTARRIEAAINAALGPGVARATDPRTVALKLEGRDVVASLADIEELRVRPDAPAVVIIDETSGTIVMGANVRISTVAIAQGNLTIRVTESPEVSQPGPFSQRQDRGGAAQQHFG